MYKAREYRRLTDIEGYPCGSGDNPEWQEGGEGRANASTSDKLGLRFENVV